MPSRSTLYTLEVLRLAASLPDPDPLFTCDGRAEERSPTCGSTVATAVSVDDEGRVATLSQTVHACAFGQASAAIVSRHSPGRSEADIAAALAALEAWLEGSAKLPDWPEIEALAPVRSRRSRHGAVLLPFRALRSALRDARG